MPYPRARRSVGTKPGDEIEQHRRRAVEGEAEQRAERQHRPGGRAEHPEQRQAGGQLGDEDDRERAVTVAEPAAGELPGGPTGKDHGEEQARRGQRGPALHEEKRQEGQRGRARGVVEPARQQHQPQPQATPLARAQSSHRLASRQWRGVAAAPAVVAGAGRTTPAPSPRRPPPMPPASRSRSPAGPPPAGRAACPGRP